MKFTISGRNIAVTEGLKEAIYEKLGKLDKYFAPDTDVYVTLSAVKLRHKIEVTIPVKGHTIRAEQESDDMYTSIDKVEEIIVRQLRKYKTKLTSKQHAKQNFAPAYVEMAEEPEEEIRIVKSKKFAIKPMTPEDACLEMELLGHDFYVFTNAETGAVNVVYKRKEHSYGLIEPEA